MVLPEKEVGDFRGRPSQVGAVSGFLVDSSNPVNSMVDKSRGGSGAGVGGVDVATKFLSGLKLLQTKSNNISKKPSRRGTAPRCLVAVNRVSWRIRQVLPVGI